MMDIHELYTGNMRSTRTVGSEEEYPVVRKSDFHSLSREDIQKVFMSLIADGWEEQRDHQTGRVSAVSKNVDGRPFKVTTDFGTGTLEVNYPVSQNLHEAEQDLRTNLSYLSKRLDENGFLILGYGIQPVTNPGRDIVAEKGRYRTLEQRFWTREHCSFLENVTDVHFHTINASNQVHIGLKNEREAIEAVNLLNLASPAIIALMGNSPIWLNGRGLRYKDSRQIFWDWVVNVSQDKFRKGIPERIFNDLDDYIKQQLSFEPVLTARVENGEVHYYEVIGAKNLGEPVRTGNITVAEPGAINRKIYDATGQVRLIDGGTVKTIPIDFIDVLAHDSFSWYEARLKAEYGTVELRCCAQQLPGEQIVVPALALGLIENLSGLQKALSRFSLEDARTARINAIKYGLNASYDGTGIFDLIKGVLDVSREGLTQRGLGEEVYLEPLDRRLMDRKSPADIILDTYSRSGIPGIVELTSI